MKNGFGNIYWSHCDCCGKEIQVHPTNYWSVNKRVCISCQRVLDEHGFERGGHFCPFTDSYWSHGRCR